MKVEILSFEGWAQLWELIHKNGYTPKATTVLAQGELANVNGVFQLKVSGTKDTLALAAGPKDAGAFGDVSKKVGQTAVVRGVMVPAKDLKAAVQLLVLQLK